MNEQFSSLLSEAGSVGTAPALPAGEVLTPRQHQVLCHATRSNMWIACELGISRHTVKNHWTAICKRLEIEYVKPPQHKRTRALLRALRLGIVALDEVDTAADERRWPEHWHWEWNPEYQEMMW